MDYELIISPAAGERLASLDGALLAVVERQLARLAADPVGLGKRGSFPYPPWMQRFYFRCDDDDGTCHHFTVLFYYLTDEKSLAIAHISHLTWAGGGDFDAENDPLG